MDDNDNVKVSVKKITEGPFFTFSRLPLDFIEKDKLFKLIFTLVYIAMAVLTLIHPFVILGRVMSSGYFNFGPKYVFVFILTWLAIAAACWLGFHLWWDRRKKAAEFGSSEFIVIPFFAEMLRTFGEWLGIMFGIIGFVGGLFTLIFLRGYSGGMLSAVLFGANFSINIGGGSDGLLASLLGGLADVLNGAMDSIFNRAVILGPVTGFLIVFISRFCAERLKVLVAIANNTKRSIPRT